MLIGLLTDWLGQVLGPLLLIAVVLVTLISVIGGAWFLIARPDWRERRPLLHAVCQVTPLWMTLRILSFALGAMVLFESGPEVLWGDATGGGVFRDIGGNSLVIFIVACQFMPFLTEFGFMEFVGVLLRGPFEKLFRLPGRAAIDATASFVSAATVGLLITIGQYERGYYTARESAAVATNFSVVSIPFSLVVAEVSGISHLYFSWYLTVIVACLFCALIMVRVPPLSRIPDDYYPAAVEQMPEPEPGVSDLSPFAEALQAATDRSSMAPGPAAFFRSSALQTLDVVFGVIPAAMTLATLTAVLVFHTPVFEVLTLPIAWLLDWLALPEASVAAPGFVVGFLDQFMPALVARNIDSELTRFVLAGLSISQLIYLAEVGVLILRSSLPLSLWNLLVIFVLRTVLVFPVFMLAGLFFT